MKVTTGEGNGGTRIYGNGRGAGGIDTRIYRKGEIGLTPSGIARDLELDGKSNWGVRFHDGCFVAEEYTVAITGRYSADGKLLNVQGIWPVTESQGAAMRDELSSCDMRLFGKLIEDGAFKIKLYPRAGQQWRPVTARGYAVVRDGVGIFYPTYYVCTADVYKRAVQMLQEQGKSLQGQETTGKVDKTNTATATLVAG